MEKKVYSSGEFAKLIGVDRRTVQRWDSEGILPAKRKMSGHRYYTDEDVRKVLKKAEEPASLRQNIIYARVSSSSQKKDLNSQEEFLRQFCNARGVVISEVVDDIGSGLNYKRKNWNSLLFEVMDKKIGTIYITHKDRFVRFGFDWFESMCRRFGTEIFVVQNETTSPEKEMIEDLLSVIRDFSGRIHGLQKYKKMIQTDPDLAEKTEDRQTEEPQD